MSETFNWSSDIAWPSGKSTAEFLNPSTEGSSSELLAQDEILSKDILNRAKIAEKLHSFIKKNKKGYVLNLDSAWGSGKTWFVRRLLLELKKYHPVCYIDAWEHDYKGEAIFLILNSIIKSLEVYQGKNSTTLEKIKNSKISILSKKLAPEIVKALTRVDIQKVFDQAEEEKKIISSKNKEYTDLLGAATKLILDEIDNESIAVKELKINIANLLDQAVGSVENETTYPLIVFVDELDRCRPNFSIEMLESIKHIFSIPNVFFIISTHSDELHHSIKSIYGNNFSSEKYLEKFFDSKITLTAPNICNFIEIHSSRLIKDAIKPSEIDLFSCDISNFYEIISGISICYEIPLRQIQKSLRELNAILQLADKNSDLNTIALTILIICRREMPLLYSEILTCNNNLKIIENFSYNTYQSINANNYLPKKTHKIKIKLNLTSRFEPHFQCSIADNSMTEPRTLMFAIINALINPPEREHIIPYTSYSNTVPTISVTELASLNYSRLHNCRPSLNSYIEAIEIGVFFE